jgi:hypothetical protein
VRPFPFKIPSLPAPHPPRSLSCQIDEGMHPLTGGLSSPDQQTVIVAQH